MVQGNIQDLCRGRTTVIVAHRLSTIQRADEILLISKGSVAERGTHQELLQMNGEYAGLWALQSSGRGEAGKTDEAGKGESHENGAPDI